MTHIIQMIRTNPVDSVRAEINRVRAAQVSRTATRRAERFRAFVNTLLGRSRTGNLMPHFVLEEEDIIEGLRLPIRK